MVATSPGPAFFASARKSSGVASSPRARKSSHETAPSSASEPSNTTIRISRVSPLAASRTFSSCSASDTKTSAAPESSRMYATW